MNKRILSFILIDSFVLLLSLTFSFLLRFDFEIPIHFSGIPIRSLLFNWITPFILVQICVFLFTGLYDRIWRFTSLFDLFSIIKSVLISSAISILGVFMIMGNIGFPRSVLLLFLILNTIMVCFSRVSVRVYYSHFNVNTRLVNTQNKKKLI